jgi:hypothetical protein
MTTSARLAAHRARREAGAVASADPVSGDEPEAPLNDAPENEGEPKPEKETTDMTDNTKEAAVTAAEAKGFADGQKAQMDRFAAVAASPEYVGREAAAVKLLTNPAFANADAAAITALLGDLPVTAAAAEPVLSAEQQRQAAEQGGRDELRATLEAVQPTGTSAEDGTDPNATEDGPKAKAARILANQKAFGGGKPLKA